MLPFRLFHNKSDIELPDLLYNCGLHPQPTIYRSNAGAMEMLRGSIQYMKQHYMKDLRLANIAHTVGYSKQHFQRKFKEIYGLNPNQYLQRLSSLD
ncbi:helix-turn-helix transcriptional regulator [Paenibacillus sp. IHBB 3054]|uniref:helix-turn-helix transcriptional regulator n=1 Tax=Paenibacillus sp. IHBB 3054 TaxID=3425689 RepID=UPI003F669636